MTKHLCDDCGEDMGNQWYLCGRWNQPEREVCTSCYRRRMEMERAEHAR